MKESILLRALIMRVSAQVAAEFLGPYQITIDGQIGDWRAFIVAVPIIQGLIILFFVLIAWIFSLLGSLFGKYRGFEWLSQRVSWKTSIGLTILAGICLALLFSALIRVLH